MEGSFSGVVNQQDRGELGGSQMVIQQHARYPAVVEPALPSASSVDSARSRIAASKSPPLQRRETPRSLQASPTGHRSIIHHRAPSVRSGPSMSPPVFTSLRHSQSRESLDQAESRTLPTRDITDENIDDAYVSFIFYCNPNVPGSADSTELRKTFRCPPRSDGKSFGIFNLWELIRKLDSKELKTWIQLAIELGVEPPSLEKKQSTQKVQQYAVRLKVCFTVPFEASKSNKGQRWMRAMHVDAFFEYCLGHPHVYYTQLPGSRSQVSDSRDGVLLEDDLALRALVPQWKPKRGRKKAEDREADDENPAKRPQLDTSVGVLHGGSFAGHSATFPHSAIPFSAFPDDMDPNDSWIPPTSSFPADAPPNAQQGQELRWRPIERDPSPAGYPQSAIIPRGHHPDVFLSAEPRSAITPMSGDKTKARRRHGPAVSSAWSGSNGSSTGKTRGRPPNRATASGPFSSFPVNPTRDEPAHGDPGSRNSSGVTTDQGSFSQFPASQYNQPPSPFQAGSRPSKLQLHVPQNPGGPVRLATPPTLMVNGVNDSGSPSHEEDAIRSQRAPDVSGTPSQRNSPESLSPEDLFRILADELLRARVFGRRSTLSPDEARGLAVSVVKSLMASCSHSPKAVAVHLGLGSHVGSRKPSSGTMAVTIEAGSESSEYIYTLSHEYTYGPNISTKVIYNNFRVPPAGQDKLDYESASHHDAIEDDDHDPDGLSDADFESIENNAPGDDIWKHRYQRLRAQMQKKEKAISQYKKRLLELVMEDV